MAKNQNQAPVTTPENDDWDDIPSNLAPVWGGEGIFEGIFVGFQEGIMTPDRFNPGQKRESTLLLFDALTPCMTEDGVTIKTGDRCGVWASAKLHAVKTIPVGSKVRLKKLGEVKIGDGTRRMQDYEMKFKPPVIEAKTHDPEKQTAPF